VSTTRLNDLLHAIEVSKRRVSDCLVVPPEYMRALRDHTAVEVKARQDDAMPSLLGAMRVFESDFARLPAKRHKKRKWMRESYHRRIQKKWTKRWGMVPAAFAFTADALRVNLTEPFPEIRMRDLASFGGFGSITIKDAIA